MMKKSVIRVICVAPKIYTMRRLLIPIVVLVVVLTSVGTSTAVWRQIAKLPQTVGCCYFLDDNFGLAGTGTYNLNLPLQIWVTMNGGATWTQAATPVGTGQVTQIRVRSDGLGYASIFSQGNPYMNLWRTTDFGNSWTDISTGQRYGAGAGVSWNTTGFAYWLAGNPANQNSNGVFHSGTKFIRSR
jgi:photosystem II stability/assembly factor-like uncharacterized protein